jgi:hypothetical protein
MRWYGSLQNRLEENCKGLKPKVGMGATEMMWSDRNAWEIIAVKDERHITARRLKCKLVSEYFTECQEYKYESDPNGYTAELFLTKKGQWRQRYYGTRQLGNVFVIGYAEEYRDPSF